MAFSRKKFIAMGTIAVILLCLTSTYTVSAEPGLVDDIIDAIEKKLINPVKSWIVEKIDQLWEYINDKLDIVQDTVIYDIGSEISSAKTDIISEITNAISSAQASIEAAISLAKDDIMNEIGVIEDKLDLWLPEIKEEVKEIEEKLDKKIAKQELRVKLEMVKVVNNNDDDDNDFDGGKRRYFMLVTLAGERVDLDLSKVMVYIGENELSPDDYIITKIIDGTYEITISIKAIPRGKARPLVVDAEHTVIDTTYTGSDMLSISRGKNG